MSKDKLTDYDATASNNTDVGGISVAEGMLPSGVNNALRELMSHQADAFGAGTPLYVDQTNNRVGIGETSPSSDLHVKGGAGANIAVQSTAGSHWRLGDAVGSSNGIFVIRDHTNSANRVQILADGKTQIAQGVTFGTDTAAANTLDDYEEGTWNASFAGSTDVQGGYYTKIGRSVTVFVYGGVNVTSVTTGLISGLPFVNNGGYVAATISHDTYTNNSYNGYVNSGASAITPIQDGTISGAQTVIGNPRYIMVSATYLTNS